MRPLLLLVLCMSLAHADARTTTFGLEVHIAPGTDGQVVTPEWVGAQVAMANHQFAALDIGFRVVGTSELPASAAHLRTRADRSALAPLVTGRVIHVFVTGQLDNVDDDAPVYGVTWRAGPRKFVILAANARDIVLAHELGHVFGLPHSTYAISIMNKSERKEPPVEQRTFDPKELAAMKPRLAWLLRAKLIEDRR